MRARWAALGAALLAGASALVAPARAVVDASCVGTDWPTYGHDIHHTFDGCTTLSPTSVQTLHPKWFFQTGDAVTAQPITAKGTVYFGSWDGNFYAVDEATGTLRWKYDAYGNEPGGPQKNIDPPPHQARQPGDATSDGGFITSSAWYEPAHDTLPNLVIFGGGYSLYALNADAGTLVWSKAFTGRPDLDPQPATDPSRIFSSPVVYHDKVLFGLTSDGQKAFRGYAAAVDVLTGNLDWRFETDVDAGDNVLNDGCGGVWSSPTVDEADKLLVLDVADCNFSNIGRRYDEHVFALNPDSGKLAWLFDPGRVDDQCDFDFGATANFGSVNGTPFLGVGGKDGTYYSLNAANGTELHRQRVVFGGFAGGFIATTAFDGNRVYGATALGDFGRFEGFLNVVQAHSLQPVCTVSVPVPPQSPAVPNVPNPTQGPLDLPLQEPSVHALAATNLDIVWQQPLSQSFGPTAVAGGMTFVGTGITPEIQIRDANTGVLLHAIPLPAACDSGVVVSGDSIYFGTGSSEQAQPDGVWSYTAAVP